jgi:hypothetical protein
VLIAGGGALAADRGSAIKGPADIAGSWWNANRKRYVTKRSDCLRKDRLNEVEGLTSKANREGARDAVGKAIIGLAKTGYRHPEHLANYGVYQGRLFIDLRG